MEGHVIHLITLAGDNELGIAHLLLQASFVVKLVLILLAIASMMCWWVIFTILPKRTLVDGQGR